MLKNNIKIQEEFVMKRVISIVIVLTMILIAFAGCGGKASESKYVGNWTLATLMYNSQVFSAKELNTFASLDIKPDGTLDANFAGDKTTDKWKEKDGKLVTDSGLIAELKDDKVVIEVKGVTMYFTK
jgi:hypothetical protein